MSSFWAVVRLVSMCAIEAGKRGRRVAVLERAERIGKKILISGGGRCNFTNLHCRPENFISANPHFCKSALARYTPDDFIAFVRRHGIAYHEKKLGQLFCDGSASEIVAMLEQECAAAGVQLFSGVEIADVQRSDGFEVMTSLGLFFAPALVVATGGLSIPKIGATSFGYDLARQFGLKIQPCRPALVPLLFNAADRQHYSDLAGVSADVIASSDGQCFREKMLFTHRGLSGPAILQVSSYWQPGEAIALDLAPETDPLGYDSQFGLAPRCDDDPARAAVRASSSFRGPMARSACPCRAHERRGRPAQRSSARMVDHTSGTEGYEKAEVTAGGVDTDELSAKTMESRKVPGLYLIGEVVDVTGHLGGFNFQWAWASGFAAGQAV